MIFMDISPTSQFTFLSAQATEAASSTDMQRAVRVLKVAQDQAKAEGQALLALINEVPSPGSNGTRISVYA
jgi:hypothetical protein